MQAPQHGSYKNHNTRENNHEHEMVSMFIMTHAMRKACADTEKTRTEEHHKNRQVNTTQATTKQQTSVDEMFVTHVISDSHRRLVKTACRPPAVQSKQRNAFSLFALFLLPLSFSSLFSEQQFFCVPSALCIFLEAFFFAGCLIWFTFVWHGEIYCNTTVFLIGTPHHFSFLLFPPFKRICKSKNMGMPTQQSVQTT